VSPDTKLELLSTRELENRAVYRIDKDKLVLEITPRPRATTFDIHGSEGDALLRGPRRGNAGGLKWPSKFVRRSILTGPRRAPHRARGVAGVFAPE
jgi:hypothetical protein